MALTTYATQADLLQRINRGDAWTTDEAVVVSQLLMDVSRLVDRYCRRSFGRTDAGTVRYFTPVRSDVLIVDDFVTLTAIATDEDGDGTWENTWSASDYLFWPYNASEVYEPYLHIRVAPRGSYAWPIGVPKGAKLTGTWGWPRVPDMIREVVLLEAARLWAHGKSPSGVVQSPEMGVFMLEPQLHPQAMARLNVFRRVMVR